MTSPTTITFFVEGSPPKKDGAQSMWGKDSELPRLKALRLAASRAMGSRSPFTGRVELTLTLYPNTSGADLDNLIGGICDGLQAGWCPRDDPRWLDVPEKARATTHAITSGRGHVRVAQCRLRPYGSRITGPASEQPPPVREPALSVSAPSVCQ